MQLKLFFGGYMSKEVVLVSAVRTAIGRFMGTLSPLKAPDIGAAAIKGALEKAGIKDDIIDEVIMGCVVQGGVGQAPARQAAIKAGITPFVSSMTINKVCGSGLKAVMLAAQSIKAGDADCIVAGGMESMTNVPYYLDKARYSGYRYGDGKLIDGLVNDGLWCAFDNCHMGILGEKTAKWSNLTREELDEYSARSQELTAKAAKEGKFEEEIVPVSIPQRKKDPIVFDKDECFREGTTADKLAKLPPAFDKDGVITAGNSSQLSDGAAACVVMSSEKAKELGLKPIAKVLGYEHYHGETEKLFYAPGHVTKNLLKKVGWDVNTPDLYEFNEAFSSQIVANIRDLGVDINKVNVNGGAIALGHPIGATGTRILVTLIHALKQRNKTKGIAALCLGGGGAVGIAVELI